MCVYIYIYIYIEREREGASDPVASSNEKASMCLELRTPSVCPLPHTHTPWP